MFEKDGSAGTLRPIMIAKCGFGGARPPGEPPSMTQTWVAGWVAAELACVSGGG